MLSYLQLLVIGIKLIVLLKALTRQEAKFKSKKEEILIIIYIMGDRQDSKIIQKELANSEQENQP